MPTSDSQNTVFTPVSDNQNTGVTPAVGQTQDPVVNNDQNQTSAFDFSLDLPDSFPSQTEENKVQAPVSNVEPEQIPQADDLLQTSDPVQAPVDVSMDFLQEEPVVSDESQVENSEEEEDSFPVPGDGRIASVEELPLDTSDFSVEPVGQNFEENDELEQSEVGFDEQPLVNQEGSLNMHSDVETSQQSFVIPEDTVNPVTPLDGTQEVMQSSLENNEEENQVSTSFMTEEAPIVDTPSEQASEVNFSAPHAEMDPFDAMRATLNQNVTQNIEEPVIAPLNEPIQEVVPSVPVQESPTIESIQAPVQEEAVAPQLEPVAEKPIGMLSLDEMIAQPVPTVAPTMNLDSMMDVSAPDPLSNPVAYPPITQPQSQATNSGMTKLVAILGSFALVIAVGFMAILKYPQEIQKIFGINSDSSANVQVGEFTGDQEHGSAELTDNLLTGDNLNEDLALTGSDEGTDVGEVTLDENQAETWDDVQEVVLGGDDSSQETAEADQKSDSSQSSTSDLGTSTSSDQAVDALGAVEEIVGEVGANETLTQQIESFKLKAQQMADTGKAQGDRMMIKYGIYVVNQVKKVQEDIANGQKMSIAERNSLKSELELSLAKGQNGGK